MDVGSLAEEPDALWAPVRTDWLGGLQVVAVVAGWWPALRES